MTRVSVVAVVALLTVNVGRAADEKGFADLVKPYLNAHCVKCHGPAKQAGDVRLDDLTAGAGKDAERWAAVRDQVRDGVMPPPKEPKPDVAAARKVVAWAAAAVGATPGRLPNQGNLIPHELLFGTPATHAGASPARIWRLSPAAYESFVRGLYRERLHGLVLPFSLVSERGIRDFADLYSVEEASAEVLLRNSAIVVDAQTRHEVKAGKPVGFNGSVPELVALFDPQSPPSAKQLEAAIQTQFRLATARPATAEEVARYAALYEKGRGSGDRVGAAKTMLQAVPMRADAVFRYETGTGAVAAGGRRILSPTELERAVSLTLGNRRNPALAAALTREAANGPSALRAAVSAHVRSTLADPKADRERVMGFFREYFEYHRAADIFKDKPKEFLHVPGALVADTDRLVSRVVAADKDVFRELLTTPHSFVNYATRRNKQTNLDDPFRSVVPHPVNDRNKVGPEHVYNFTDWPSPQPTEVPKDTRIGVLMQPSWLAAWSTNFDNDPVRRGRWVRERLLGGTVPDLPIGVVAMVPDDPHRTFRDRLTVTRATQCWKCHQRMDELGLPFEQFDHFGRFRTTETVRDVAATAKNVDKGGKSLGVVTREVPVNTAGLIADSGDPGLDGPVKDPREMVRMVANSDRARQVFVRHAFRYFLGRNESLADAKTLQDADAAYVKAGGSFKALVESLLTSDSFLYRVAVAAQGGAK